MAKEKIAREEIETFITENKRDHHITKYVHIIRYNEKGRRLGGEWTKGNMPIDTGVVGSFEETDRILKEYNNDPIKIIKKLRERALPKDLTNMHIYYLSGGRLGRSSPIVEYIPPTSVVDKDAKGLIKKLEERTPQIKPKKPEEQGQSKSLGINIGDEFDEGDKDPDDPSKIDDAWEAAQAEITEQEEKNHYKK